MRSSIHSFFVRSDSIPGGLSPQQAFSRVRSRPWAALLESTARDSGLGRYSYVVADPFYRIWTDQGQVFFQEGERSWTESEPPLTVLRRVLADLKLSPLAGLPPFQGGAVGLWSFELGRTLEDTPVSGLDDLNTPDMRVGIYDCVLAWDHAKEESWLFTSGPDGDLLESRANEFLGWLKEGTGDGETGEPKNDPGPPEGRKGAPQRITASSYPVPGFENLRSTFTKDEYLAGVERVREYILAGDIFQANLSHRLETPFPGDPFQLYGQLAKANPAPFAAYMETEGSAIVSASPERFLKVSQGSVETRPIKGTAPRGQTQEEDLALATALEGSEKDRAENVMIVDLLRNDLSRVCQDGTVEVPSFCAVETHPTVHHLVSVVTGRLREGLGPVDALEASFPGGSITGAPKLRAMEIIAEMEPTHRGAYTGSIGYIGLDGSADTSIAIRTMTVRNGVAFVQAGGAVIADSEAEAEYRETLHKAQGLLAALDQIGQEGTS